jgi:hypothetical protein
MLQEDLDAFKTAFNNLSEALTKYDANLKDTKNKNWAKNVESCRKKVKTALDIATAKLAKLQAALEQFKIDSVKKAKMNKDGVFTLDDEAKRKVDSVEFTLKFAKQALDNAITITTEF